MSELMLTRLGGPQGSILGSILFDFYVLDLQGQVDQPRFQYADDHHCGAWCKADQRMVGRLKIS